MIRAKQNAKEALQRFALLTTELVTNILEMGDPEFTGRPSEKIMQEILETDAILQATVKICWPWVFFSHLFQ